MASDNQFRGPLGGLLRTAAAQLGGVKDLAVRGTEVGRAELDAQLTRREKTRALARLGQAILEAVEDEELEVPERCATALAAAQEAVAAADGAQQSAKRAWQGRSPKPSPQDDDVDDQDDG
jgi:hypothetical protein